MCWLPVVVSQALTRRIPRIESCPFPWRPDKRPECVRLWPPAGAEARETSQSPPYSRNWNGKAPI
jgi:hypothetical protein